MKNIILAAAAAVSLLGAGAMATSASAMPSHSGGHASFGGRGGFSGAPAFRGGAGFRGAPVARDGFRGVDRGGFRGDVAYRGGWARGGFWPRGFGVVIVDPLAYDLYAAPYGYEWMQAPDGSMVLVAVGTGLIADVVIR